MEYQGYDITPSQAIIPKIQTVLNSFRSAGFPIYHTREGNSLVYDTLIDIHGH